MLAISPISNGDEVGNFPKPSPDEFLQDPMLEDIDFDDLFLGFEDGDVLPDLEVDPSEIFADFSFESEENSGSVTTAGEFINCEDDLQKFSAATTAAEGGEEEKGLSLSQDEEVVSATTSSKEENRLIATSKGSSLSSKTNRGHKPLAKQAKSSHGKRKVKVDWTPELHRKFVQAVEQLGLDKAVPSRILELMGTDCLTRHNIASHLQKYRCHRKHLLAREAEAASWSQRRQMLASSGTAPAGVTKRDMNPWLAPTIGFPPPPPPPPVIQPFRPLHVWGHPTMNPNFVPVWPKHIIQGRSPLPASWASPTTPPPQPSPWLHHYPRGPRDGWVSNGLSQGSPCFPRPMPPTMMQRFPVLPVPGVPPHSFYRPAESSVTAKNKQLGSQIQPLDDHPSKESIDATIGDVLAKPWLPLPLGLKPPSLESVMVELQKQGISNIPPASS